jgi:hypothetical protein
MGSALHHRPTAESASPYRIAPRDGALWLHVDATPVAEVGLRDLPPYYREKLPDGRPVAEIAPVIEWGYLVYLTVFRVCQYFGAKEECQFCDINNNYRQQIQEGRPYTGVKSVADVLAALERIDATDTFSRAYTITGGSVTSLLQGKNEVEFYSQYVEAIENKFPGRWISVVTQAWPNADVKGSRRRARRFITNYSVGPRVIPKICPGKTRYVGAMGFCRIVNAADVFGPHVILTRPAGSAMAKPYGYTEVGCDPFHCRGLNSSCRRASRRALPRGVRSR